MNESPRWGLRDPSALTLESVQHGNQDAYLGHVVLLPERLINLPAPSRAAAARGSSESVRGAAPSMGVRRARSVYAGQQSTSHRKRGSGSAGPPGRSGPSPSGPEGRETGDATGVGPEQPPSAPRRLHRRDQPEAAPCGPTRKPERIPDRREGSEWRRRSR
jgi:hypothetical protein